MTLLQNEQKLIVTQANALARSIQVMSIHETRIIRTVVAVVSRTDKSFRKVRIYVPELCKLFNLQSSHSIYQKLPEAMDKLLGRVVTIERGSGSWKKFQWVTSAEYTSGSDSESGIGYMDIELHNDMAEFLLQLNSHFFSYPLKNIAGMQSQYSIRMYELLLSDSHSGNITRTHYELQDLKLRLGCEDNYRNYKDFRVNVVDKAQRDCAAYTNLSFEYQEQRLGRKVIGLVFHLTLEKTATPAKPSVALAPDLDDDETMRRIQLQNALLQAGFSEDPNQFINTLGVEHVRYVLEQALADYERAKNTNNPIRNLGGYIHHKLRYAENVPPSARTAQVQLEPSLSKSEIQRIAETLRTTFENAQMVFVNQQWETLSAEKREELQELMWVVLPQFTINKLQESGWQGALFETAKSAVLEKEGLLAYPPQLQSVQDFVEHGGLLQEFSEKDRAKIIATTESIL